MYYYTLNIGNRFIIYMHLKYVKYYPIKMKKYTAHCLYYRQLNYTYSQWRIL